jgi:hypothetical protein
MNIKPLSKLTRLLVVLLKVNIALTIVGVFAGIYSWFEYSNLDRDVNLDEILLPAEIVNALVGLIQLFVFIFLGVTFLRWIYRVNKNLHLLSSEPMTFSPGWSVGWYFIPIACLFKPYQAMKEIWAVAHRGTSSGSTIIWWWWFLFLMSGFVAQIQMRLSFRADNVITHRVSAVVDVISNGVDVILSIVALMLVAAIARAYAENYVEPDAAPGGTTEELLETKP